MTESTADTNLWLRSFHQSPGATKRLICFPHAGGSASYYFDLSRQLSPQILVQALQYPGRQDRRREAHIPAIAGLVEQMLPAIKAGLSMPTAFFGHSMGAIVAYEVALRLERESILLEHFFASARRAPSRYREADLRRKTDADIAAELNRLNGTNSTLMEDPEVLEMIMPALRSDYRAVAAYRHDATLKMRSPITAMVGDQDADASTDEVEAWAEHTSGTFDLKILPGGHFYLVPQLVAVSEVILAQLGSTSD